MLGLRAAGLPFLLMLLGSESTRLIHLDTSKYFEKVALPSSSYIQQQHVGQLYTGSIDLNLEWGDLVTAKYTSLPSLENQVA